MVGGCSRINLRKDYSVTKDWDTLKQMIAEQKSEFDPEVFEDISKGIFEEDNVLCACKIQKVKCPKCFPSKAAILSYVHDRDWRFDLVNKLFSACRSARKSYPPTARR